MNVDSTSAVIGAAVALSIGYVLGKQAAPARSVVPGNQLFSASQGYGGLIFASGQVGLAPGSPPKVVDGGIKAQARAALTHLKTVLENSGSDLKHVLKCECLLNDIKDYAAFNEVYLEFFSDAETRPARLCFAPGGLPLGALVEVQATAIKA